MELKPTYPIVTERLLLRPLTPDDAEQALRYRGDPEVCRYLPFEPMDRGTIEERLSGDLANAGLDAEGQAVTLGVEVQGEGRLIGDVVLFYRSERHLSGEVGYVFHPEVAGKGYATEASRAVLRLAFEEFGLHRVTAVMDPRNEVSARLAERLGMRREAHFVLNEVFKGEWADTVIYAILAEEWAAQD